MMRNRTWQLSFVTLTTFVTLTSVLFLTTSTTAMKASSKPTTPPKYAISELNALSARDVTSAHSVSDSGYIGGFSGDDAVYWRHGTNVDLGAPPPTSGNEGVGVNNHGDIAGDAFNFVTFTSLPLFWPRGGSLQILPMLDLEDALAAGINDQGEISGTATRDIHDPFDNLGFPNQRRAVVWNHSAIMDLGTLGGLSSIADGAYGLNDRGDVVGAADIDSQVNPVIGGYTFHAALWTHTTGTHPTVQDLGALAHQPDNAVSLAEGINEVGQVVGWSLTDVSDSCFGGPQQWGFLWQHGTMYGLQPLVGDCDAEAIAINNLGQAVGFSIGLSARGRVVYRPVLWQNHQTIDLSALIPSSSGWLLSLATGINDKGEIVGDGISPQGFLRAFVLRPLPDTGDARASQSAPLSNASRSASSVVDVPTPDAEACRRRAEQQGATMVTQWKKGPQAINALWTLSCAQ
jgi:probable HAF family extracellular repeat protein